MGPLKPEDVKLPLGWVGGGAPGGLGRASEGRPEGEEAEGQGACRTGRVGRMNRAWDERAAHLGPFRERRRSDFILSAMGGL